MDATTLTALVKELSEAHTGGKTEDVIRILTTMKMEVEPTEDILRTTKSGVAVGKLRTSPTASIAALAKSIVKLWKDAVEEKKKKRKRDDEGVKKDKEDGVKRVKAEVSSTTPTPTPPVASTSASTPERKPTPSKTRKPSLSDSKPSLADPEVSMGDARSSTADSKPAVADSKTTQSREKSPSQTPLSTIDSERTVPRTAKTDAMVSSLVADISGGESTDSVRDKCTVMIYDALAADSTADSRILKERAIGIERSAYKLFNFSSGNEYRGSESMRELKIMIDVRPEMRSLFLNLKDKGNPGLRNEIVIGHINSEQVVNMTKDEMASESMKALNEKIASDNLFKAKAVGETLAETDAFKCGRCQQRKCTYYQMQTRSADEPMTNCGNRWKFS
ncbi:transcription elongation factor S-II, partial [Tremellales sp. Uapishka_1]